MELGYRITSDERENIRRQFSYFGYYFQRFWQFLGSLLLLFGIVIFFLRILRFPFKLLFRKKVIAYIREIRVEPALGASWFWWTYVIFYIPKNDAEMVNSGKAKRHRQDDLSGWEKKIKLYPGQAVKFLIEQTNGEGDKGELKYFGKRMIYWKTLVPRESERFQVFISYPHEKKFEAAFISDLLNKEMLHVWVDKEMLRVGDNLPDTVTEAIKNSCCFIPLLCPEYVTSSWCSKELQIASESGRLLRILPIKISEEKFFIPEFIKKQLEATGEALHANINNEVGLNEIRQLARRIYTESRDQR